MRLTVSRESSSYMTSYAPTFSRSLAGNAVAWRKANSLARSGSEIVTDEHATHDPDVLVGAVRWWKLSPRRLEAGVQVARPDDRLDRVGDDRGLVPSAARLLAPAQLQVLAELDGPAHAGIRNAIVKRSERPI